MCEYFLDAAAKREVEIWTSSLSLAEVFKKKCGQGSASIDSSQDADFENFIQQDFLVEVQVDHEVGVTARRLLRSHPPLKKPMDAIHLATAVLHDVHEFHTFDQENLLALDGKISKRDGTLLRIVAPTFPPGHQASLELKEGDQPAAENEAPVREPATTEQSQVSPAG